VASNHHLHDNDGRDFDLHRVRRPESQNSIVPGDASRYRPTDHHRCRLLLLSRRHSNCVRVLRASRRLDQSHLRLPHLHQLQHFGHFTTDYCQFQASVRNVARHGGQRDPQIDRQEPDSLVRRYKGTTLEHNKQVEKKVFGQFNLDDMTFTGLPGKQVSKESVIAE